MSDRIDELVDTPEQALRYLDTVMCSDNEGLRRGAYNRVSIHIKQLATIAREVEAERDALLAEYEVVDEGSGDETADGGCDCLSCRIIRAHDNVKRVMHSE